MQSTQTKLKRLATGDVIELVDGVKSKVTCLSPGVLKGHVRVDHYNIEHGFQRSEVRIGSMISTSIGTRIVGRE